MSDEEVQLFTTMSPASIAPIVDDPDVYASARDTEFRMVWCNQSYADHCGTTIDKLIGTTLYDIMTPVQA